MDYFNVAFMCLALNVYHEARGESLVGQYEVAYVTLNRARKYNADLCDVVFAKKQFSWTIGARDSKGKLFPAYLPKDQKAWQSAQEVARFAIRHQDLGLRYGALMFHATNITPSWAPACKYLYTIGHHKFYTLNPGQPWIPLRLETFTNDPRRTVAK